MTLAPLSELATALAGFQKAMPVVAKTKTATLRGKDGAPGYSYTYAGLAEVSAAAAPLLAEHGLSFTCVPTVDEHGHILLSGVLLHESGEQMTGSLPITGGTPQAVGSALTYARRYLMGCMTGIVTDDDDDGALASRKARKAAAVAEQPAAPQQPGRTVRRQPRSATPVPAGQWEAPLDPWGADTGRQPPGDAPTRAEGSPSSVGPHVPQVVPQANEPAADELSPALRASLMAAASRLGIDPTADRDMRLALWSALMARPITSANDLTRAEALTLLRRMNDCETGAVEWDYSVTTGAVTLRHLDREPPA